MATRSARHGLATFAAPATEKILQSAERNVEILVARGEITVTRAEYAAGLHVADPHLHHDHVDAFYVLEGTLVFQIGHEAREVRVTAGGCVAVAPHVPHAFRVDGQAPARWLTIHTPDGGFAAFMRGVRDSAAVDWDVHPVRETSSAA
jgi:mannose-6-phosphate isomerase-like protein (cupin superfamily)